MHWLHPSSNRLRSSIGGRTCSSERMLGQGSTDPVETTRRSFEWVRDEIKHSADYCLIRLRARHRRSCATAADTATRRVICWRRCCGPTDCRPDSVTSASASMAAAHLLSAWTKRRFASGRGMGIGSIRANRGDINAQFTPPVELAFCAAPQAKPTWQIWADPLPVVVNALRAHDDDTFAQPSRRGDPDPSLTRVGRSCL